MEKHLTKVKHGKTMLDIIETRYCDGSLAVFANEASGECYCDVSTNLSTDENDSIWVKADSTNLEIAIKLEEQGILSSTGEIQKSGFNKYLKFMLNK